MSNEEKFEAQRTVEKNELVRDLKKVPTTSIPTYIWYLRDYKDRVFKL